MQFVDDDWLAANDLLPLTPPTTNPPSPDLNPVGPSKDVFKGATVRTLRLKPVTTVLANSACEEAIETMREKGFDQLPVLAPTGKRLVGLVTLGNLLSWIGQGRASGSSPVSEVMFSFSKISEMVTDLKDIAHVTQARASKTLMTNGESDSQGILQRRKFIEITLDTPLNALSRFFEWNSAAVVTERDGGRHMKPVAVVTKVDLLTWLVKQGKASSKTSGI